MLLWSLPRRRSGIQAPSAMDDDTSPEVFKTALDEGMTLIEADPVVNRLGEERNYSLC